MAENQQHCEIKLVATPGSWRLYSARKMDKRFKVYEQKVLQRDRYTCQFCGFQARIFQEIVNLDCNYTNNRLSNLVTACCFCAQCFLLNQWVLAVMEGGL